MEKARDSVIPAYLGDAQRWESLSGVIWPYQLADPELINRGRRRLNDRYSKSQR